LRGFAYITRVMQTPVRMTVLKVDRVES